MTSDKIKKILLQKYSKKNYLCFTEMPTVTGHKKKNYIDFYTIGVWKNDSIVGYEIKISRQDFLQDVRDFKNKQGAALRATEQYYYICPWELIQPNEVPENVGLCWVNKGYKIVTKKEAPFRPKEDLPAEFIKSLLRKNATKVKRTNYPIKYLFEEMSENDMDKLVDKMVKEKLDRQSSWRIDSEVKRKVNGERAKMNLFLSEERSKINDTIANYKQEIIEKAKYQIQVKNKFEALFGYGSWEIFLDDTHDTIAFMNLSKLLENEDLKNMEFTLNKLMDNFKTLKEMFYE